jgi:hypothetical protein
MLEYLFQPMHLLAIFIDVGKGIRGFRFAMKEPPNDTPQKPSE